MFAIKIMPFFFFFIGRIKMNCAECPVDPSAFRVHVGNVPLL